MPFGCIPDETYENAEFDLDINDRLIFYTDGIIEIRNNNEKMFGIKNFQNLIIDTASYDIEEFADNIINTIQKWYNTEELVFTDDVTLLALDINKVGG